MEASNESEVTGSENELPHRSSHAQFITSVAYEQPVIATKDEGLSVSTKINIKIVLCRMHNAQTEPCLYRGTTQRSAAGTCCREAFRKLGALYAAGIDPKLYYVHHMCGASVNTGLNLEYGSLLPSLSMPAL